MISWQQIKQQMVAARERDAAMKFELKDGIQSNEQWPLSNQLPLSISFRGYTFYLSDGKVVNEHGVAYTAESLAPIPGVWEELQQHIAQLSPEVKASVGFAPAGGVHHVEEGERRGQLLDERAAEGAEGEDAPPDAAEATERPVEKG